MKRGNHSKSRFSKGLVMMLALVLVFGIAVGGTIAWLTDKTETVKNTFTTSGVDITLVESAKTEANKGEFKMIPGHTITKDPVVTVLANSEKCYLFVEVAAAGSATDGTNTYGFDAYLDYDMAVEEDGTTPIWTQLKDTNSEPVANVFYRVVETSTAAQPFQILKDNKVMVSQNVTNEMMDAIDTDAERPTLSFTAYACQYYSTNDTAMGEYAAWQAVSTN